jgi:hypothetical protein
LHSPIIKPESRPQRQYRFSWRVVMRSRSRTSNRQFEQHRCDLTLRSSLSQRADDNGRRKECLPLGTSK